MTTVEDLRLITFPVKPSTEATLAVYEHPKDVPFPIARIFVVTADKACIRGRHAHKKCQQLLVCLNGCIEVTVDDGFTKKTIAMNDACQGLLIPAGLWAEQNYQQSSILMVIASHPYDEADYIRDYDEFRTLQG